MIGMISKTWESGIGFWETNRGQKNRHFRANRRGRHEPEYIPAFHSVHMAGQEPDYAADRVELK